MLQAAARPPRQSFAETPSTVFYQSGHSEDGLGVVDSGLLEHLSGNGDGRVDRVGDNCNHSVGADLSSCSSNGSNN